MRRKRLGTIQGEVSKTEEMGHKNGLTVARTDGGRRRGDNRGDVKGADC